MNIFLGKNIKYLRENKRMKQSDLAQEFDLDTSTITGWEKERSYPRFAELLRLREYFSTDLERLIFSDLSVEGSYVQEGEEGYVSKYEIISKKMEDIVERLEEAMDRIRRLEEDNSRLKQALKG